jgi:hypothetical protein
MTWLRNGAVVLAPVGRNNLVRDRSRLRERIRASGLTVHEYQAIDDFARKIRGDMKALVGRLYPASEVVDPLIRATAAHTTFAQRLTTIYEGRHTDFDALDAHVDGSGPLGRSTKARQGRRPVYWAWPAIAGRFSGSELDVLNVYPGGWEVWGDEGLHHLHAKAFELSGFYGRALAAGATVICGPSGTQMRQYIDKFEKMLPVPPEGWFEGRSGQDEDRVQMPRLRSRSFIRSVPPRAPASSSTGFGQLLSSRLHSRPLAMRSERDLLPVSRDFTQG